jgi:hypothetical protein
MQLVLELYLKQFFWLQTPSTGRLLVAADDSWATGSLYGKAGGTYP